MDKSLCTKATSPDDVPTPGYMFNEIARITHASADAAKVRVALTRMRSVALSTALPPPALLLPPPSPPPPTAPVGGAACGSS